MKKILIICLFSFAVSAREECNTITSSDQAYLFSFQKKDEISARLNKEYHLYINEIKKSYSSDVKLGNKLLDKVHLAQSEWMAYMNASCDIYAFQIEENSKSHTLAINHCVSEMSEKRIKEIAKMIENI
ncbi:DUF1311 domain-containing protein [Erwinia mallotivora]|uniref:DUF1311 domain-containing protein n=1 Tax=Erwinia mallotivora TaxID=69222 RepID=UPI0021C13B56|nr:DUF1311 domain-containing protein [Erwinia mallotivora]